MSDTPWLTIIGMGEHGVDALPGPSQAALAAAEVVMGPPRHLDLIGDTGAERIDWPVPFSDGMPILKGLAGRKTVVLASGDPFWFGVGSLIAKTFAPAEWQALPAPSTFSLAAARLGWPLERTLCFGLHAAPVEQIVPSLAPGQRMILLLRDGDAMGDAARVLRDRGFVDSTVTVLERLGGPHERITSHTAAGLAGTFAHPLCAAIEVAGPGAVVQTSSGRADDLFAHDGQITKRPIRAVTLSSLAPRPFETLWDIGGGSGSIALEWALSHPTTRAISVEPRADRAARIRQNAATLGLAQRVSVIEGAAPDALTGLDRPDAVFIGGGLSRATLDAVVSLGGARLVVNAVTLESEGLLTEAQAKWGGTLMRIALSEAQPLGPKQGWVSAYPVVQWSMSP